MRMTGTQGRANARSRWERQRSGVDLRWDISSEVGAKALAARLKAFWLERGYEIEANAVERPFNQAMRSTRWEVRTDLVNGLPKNWREAA